MPTRDELVCPACHTDDHLSGERHGELIRITCTACDLTWDRDPARHVCPTCGRDDVRAVAQPYVEKARGTQLSITAMRIVYLCHACDADVLRSQLQSNTGLPPRENPATDVR
jgi:transposase-like protein